MRHALHTASSTRPAPAGTPRGDPCADRESRGRAALGSFACRVTFDAVPLAPVFCVRNLRPAGFPSPLACADRRSHLRNACGATRIHALAAHVIVVLRWVTTASNGGSPSQCSPRLTPPPRLRRLADCTSHYVLGHLRVARPPSVTAVRSPGWAGCHLAPEHSFMCPLGRRPTCTKACGSAWCLAARLSLSANAPCISLALVWSSPGGVCPSACPPQRSRRLRSATPV